MENEMKKIKISNTDRACEILHEVNFSTESDMYKAIARVEEVFNQLATLQARVRELEEQIERQNQSMKRLRGDNQLDQQEGIDF